MSATATYNMNSISINGDVLDMPDDASLSLTDVSMAEIAVTEHQLQKIKVAAEENARNYATFLANMSHELRSPLNAILGFSELLLLSADEDDPSGQTASYASHINTSGKQLLKQIDDMLRISKINSERLGLLETKVCIDKLLDAIDLMIRPRADRAGIRFAMQAPTREVHVWADERRLSQALLNVLSNAVKFTPRGGDISLRVKRDEARGLIITIRNSGMPFPAQDIPEALSEYGHMALKMGDTLEAGGTGLPLSRRLVELHNGSLAIESDAQKGTSITIKLPKERVIL